MSSWKRLTATPYQLSECYIHLVHKPEKNDEAWREKFGELVSAPVYVPWNPLKAHFFL